MNVRRGEARRAQARRGIIIGGLVLLIIAAPVVWWLASPLFITNTVDEAFPVADGSTNSAGEAMAETATDETATADAAEGTVAETSADTTADTSNVSVDEPSTDAPDEPGDNAVDSTGENAGEEIAAADDASASDAADGAMPAEWQIVQQGEFMDADSFHQGSGSATIYQLGDQRVLRFENFEVTNGPDLQVFLVENLDATHADGMGQTLDLGSLKGNVGNQNYEIPADVDLSAYSGVMIYCEPFHVVFATASLAQAQ